MVEDCVMRCIKQPFNLIQLIALPLALNVPLMSMLTWLAVLLVGVKEDKREMVQSRSEW